MTARQGWSDDRIDSLDYKVDAGFRLVDERFKLVDRRFEQIDKRLERIEDGIADMVKEMHALHRTMSQYALALTTALITLTAAMGGLALTQL